ncbi:hypothetical protein HK101_004284 [Irineochytrium annulatum]|nr:hypothetical protein HK101_004284 [Irineochytrium annulatum]
MQFLTAFLLALAALATFSLAAPQQADASIAGHKEHDKTHIEKHDNKKGGDDIKIHDEDGKKDDGFGGEGFGGF